MSQWAASKSKPAEALASSTKTKAYQALQLSCATNLSASLAVTKRFSCCEDDFSGRGDELIYKTVAHKPILHRFRPTLLELSEHQNRRPNARLPAGDRCSRSYP